MDVAVIDWKDSKFEKDILYEDINAPQWIDFSDYNPPVDDEAWFCRPDCDHPKTVEDFCRQRSPNSAKLQRKASVSEISNSGDRNRRDPALKKRGFPLKDSKTPKSIQDDENQNPNFTTPLITKAKAIKETIKSSSEKNPDFIPKEEPSRLLKPTLSARNLFAGRDILNQVTEFCNEVKRLATRTKDEKKPETGVLQESSKGERKPLLEVKKEKYEERVLQIRTNPPSPQCFSANPGTIKATPPSKASRLRPQERGVLGEISSKEVKKEVKGNKNQGAVPLLTQNEGKGLDVFWFFKPCTLST